MPSRKVIEAILAEVPAYRRLPSLREVDALVDRLTTLPGVSRRRIGRTAEGELLTLLEVGAGPRTALVVGVPHPDEPLGALVTTHLVRWLASHPAATRALGWRWLMMPVLDRRGLRRNEGWLRRPADLTIMAREFFREPTEDQIEWTFPARHEGYAWTRSRPETRALMKVMQAERPALYCGLHHCAFHPAYYYVSADLPAVYPELHGLARRLRLPLSTAAPDVPFGQRLARGVFAMYGLRDYLDHYRATDPERVATLRRGACSDEWYQKEVGGFSFNCEVPLFHSARRSGGHAGGRSWPALLAERGARERVRVSLAERWLARLAPWADLADPLLLDAATKHVAAATAAAAHGRRRLTSEPDRPATRAEVLELEVVADLEDLLFLGQVWQALESACLAGAGPRAERLLAGADRQLARLAHEVAGRAALRPVPLRAAVRLQLGSLLLFAAHLRRGGVSAPGGAG